MTGVRGRARRGILSPMFTGIISDIGEVAARDGGRFAIRCGYAAESIAIGASIACDGACLTATEVEPTATAAARLPSMSPTRRWPKPRSATGSRAGASTWNAR